MINIPKDKSTSPHLSYESTYVARPIFVPTQVVPPVFLGETLDTIITGPNNNFPSRSKRKPCSEQENMSLFDVVQKIGKEN